MQVKIVLDLLHILSLRARSAHNFGVPALLHQKGQQGKQSLADLHIPHVIIRGRQRVQCFETAGVGCGIFRVKARLAAALTVFFVDGCHIRAVKVRPPQLPQIVARIMAIGAAAVEKHTVPGA